MSLVHSSLQQLKRRLEQSRIRQRNLLTLRALVVSLLVASSCFLVLRLMQFFWIFLPGSVIGWSGIGFLIAGFLTGIWVYRKTPSLLELAKQADQKFGLHETCSTALELESRQAEGTQELLNKAVIRCAEGLVTQIEPRDLIPFKLPRLSWLALVLLVAAGFTQLGLPKRFSPVTPVLVAEPLTEDERVEIVSNLRQTSDLLKDEAEQRQDPYLQALAQAFNELSQKIEAGTVDTRATQLELERLMEHLDRAYEGDTAQTITETPTSQPNPDVVSQPLPADAIEAQTPAEAQGASAGTASRPNSRELDDLINQLSQVNQNLQASKENREANQASVSQTDREKYGPYITPEGVEAMKRLEEKLQEEAAQRAGQPVGGAQESTAGEGDLAGEGTQELTGEGFSTDLEALNQIAEDVILPEASSAEGQTIKVERAPDSQFSEVSDAQLPEAQNWQNAQEAELRHDLLLPRDREMVSRYFERAEANVANP